MPAAASAAYAVGGARKWKSLGSGVPRVVTADSRFTIAKSAAMSCGANSPTAVAGSSSSAALRPVKCTSPPKARVRSTGPGGLGVDDGRAGEDDAGATVGAVVVGAPGEQAVSDATVRTDSQRR